MSIKNQIYFWYLTKKEPINQILLIIYPEKFGNFSLFVMMDFQYRKKEDFGS